MINEHWILEGKTPKAVDLMTWAKWLESPDRIIKQTNVGDVKISTVFLGLDYSFSNEPDHEPILYETMVFGGKLNDSQERYTTYDLAEAGHAKWVKKVEASVDRGE